MLRVTQPDVRRVRPAHGWQRPSCRILEKAGFRLTAIDTDKVTYKRAAYH